MKYKLSLQSWCPCLLTQYVRVRKLSGGMTLFVSQLGPVPACLSWYEHLIFMRVILMFKIVWTFYSMATECKPRSSSGALAKKQDLSPNRRKNESCWTFFERQTAQASMWSPLKGFFQDNPDDTPFEARTRNMELNLEGMEALLKKTRTLLDRCTW